MNRKELIKTFCVLGKLLQALADGKSYPGTLIGLTEEEFTGLQTAISKASIYNPWFTENNVRKALKGIASWLNETTLESWLAPYTFAGTPKTVGIIMPGNIPLVGFHDFLSVLMSGHNAAIKLSSEDTYLWNLLLSAMIRMEPRMNQQFSIQEAKLGKIDAVIATGSDNSSRYFEYYFGKYPHIIRKNRSSVAIINEDDSDEDLENLALDIFSFFGLGCRNVSHILVPEGFDLNRIFKALLSQQEVMNHHKYANNYEYQRAVSLLNQEDVLENGFVLLKRSNDLHSPLAVVNYSFFPDENTLADFIHTSSDQIQAVVGRGYIPFGSAQIPAIDDYADGVNTLQFLATL